MTFIEPLNMEVWFLQILSGSPEIFTAIALLAIAGMAGYFRMSGIALFMMIGIFLLMFAGFIASPLLILISVIGGLLIGFTLSKIFVQ